MRLQDIKGVGKKKEQLLNELGIYSCEDLYTYLPSRYEDRSKKVKIVNAIDGIKQFFELRIISISKTYFYNGNKSISRVKASDESKSVDIIWYNDRFTSRNLKINNIYKFFGYYDANKNAIINPIVSTEDDDSIGGIYPIYTSKISLSSKEIIKYKDYLFDNEIRVEEYFDDKFLLKNNLIEINNIYKAFHRPKDNIDLYNALYNYNLRNIYLEKLANKIYKEKLNTGYIKFNDIDIDNIINSLSFTLTNSQINAINEIKNDMISDKRMNRLLIGDVGSGKTIIAILSAVLAIKNNYQVAFMAPTEILAIQHFEKYKEFLHKFDIKSELLIGSSKEKTGIYKNLEKKDIDIVFGTHALFQSSVNFAKLGLIITDEQQRFGVYQRKLLSDKGLYPDMISLSATPIPRTLALTLYDDLDLTFIEELPKDRKPIKSYLTSIYKEKDFIDFAYKQVRKNNQVYIVVSRVENDEENELESVDRLYTKLNKYLNNRVNLGKLHGKMDAKTKEEIQNKFQKGQIDILIATSIVEVGIDVPKANVMIIYDANQFGLSQLHQIRGRVGRSDIQSYCFFVVNSEDKISDKLRFITDNLNGFEIAKKDLELRGSGDIYGTNQSGFIEVDNSFFINEQLISTVNHMVKDTNFMSEKLQSIISNKVKNLEKIVMN